MTDNSDDPWKSLADDLGVQPTEEPSRPVPPPPTTPHTTSSFRSPPAAPIQKKVTSDWNALAGELGLQPSPADKTPTGKPDPVRELLGFPPPAARQEIEPIDEKPKYRDADPEFDEFDSYDSRSQRDSSPGYDQPRSSGSAHKAADEPLDPRDVDPRTPDNNSSEDREFRPSRRRGRRGRGGSSQGRGDERGRRDDRGRSEHPRDRGSRPGQPSQGQRSDRRPLENQPGEIDRGEPSEIDRDDADEFVDRNLSEPIADEFGAGIADADSETGLDGGENRARETGDRESRPKRGRRRGRRGRGSRTRGERSDQPEGNRTQSRKEPDDSGTGDELDNEFGADSETLEGYLSAEARDLPSGGGADDELADDDHGDADGDHHSARNSVRDIMTWKEAIGLIIEGNLQGRSRSPQPQSQGGSHNHPRNSRGRGRGRGRGQGRGNHRG